MRCRTCGQEIRFGDSVENGICQRCRVPDARGHVAFGAGAFLLFMSIKLLGHNPIIGLTAGGLGVFFVILGAVSRSSSDRRLQQLDAAQDPDRTQIAGRMCPICEKKIFSDFDGVACDQCATACHEACLGMHKTRAHKGTGEKHPYRR